MVKKKKKKHWQIKEGTGDKPSAIREGGKTKTGRKLETARGKTRLSK